MTMSGTVPGGAGDRRLLVLDDDALIGETVRRIAQMAGFEVRLVIEASGFLEVLEAWSPTHIALDLRMPDMDGMEVIAELGRRRCSATIIIASGVGERVLAAAARSATEHGLFLGAVLAKPFTASAFRAALSPSGSTGTNGGSGTHSHPVPDSTEEFSEALASAITEDRLAIALQPKVDFHAGGVAGFEALVRWRHQNWGIVPPATFLPVAARMGLMVRVTEAVMTRSADWLRSLRGRGANHVTIAINVSAAIVTDGVQSGDRLIPFEDWAQARCVALGVEPERIIFELTETDAMSDSLSSLDTLTRLRMKGFQLSIDDFGTGYSSLARLARLPFSELKIDRSFVAEMAASREALAIVRTAVDLAHSLHLVCVAEGIEETRTMDLLRELGCDLGQGYLIARPMAPEDATAWLRARDHAAG